MKIVILSVALFLTTFFAFADVVQKASEMQQPLSEPASKTAKKRAHKKVEKSQKLLLKKLENRESPAAIGNAKARVQIDRTESNRQDLLEQNKNDALKKPAE